ncbi:MAG: SGNH/GDSL hydrolase family protein [Lachnospiraceae bacterium]|nr:SGNH/GDSL hydrolase family protein [Lachnospiraceae bacterium]
MADYKNSEVRRAREARAKKARKQLMLGIAVLAVVIVIVIVAIIAGLAKKKGSSKKNKSGSEEAVQEQIEFNPEINVTDVCGKVAINFTTIPEASKYNILRRDKDSSEPAVVASIDETGSETEEYIDATVSKHNEYIYSVMAETKSGATATSEEKTVYVLPRQPKIVLVGECYVVGIDQWALDRFPKKAVALGTEGATTYKLINETNFTYEGSNVSALERAALEKPDIVYFLVGMNEAANGDSASTIQNYQTIVDQLQGLNANVKIVVLAIPPTGKTSTLNIPKLSKRRKFNEAYKDFTEANENVYFCDYTSVIEDEEGYLADFANGGDGCHWTSQATCDVVDNILQWTKDTIYAGN